LSGPIGVGKTTVGQDVSNLLERSNAAHSFIDLDAMAQTYPRPPDAARNCAEYFSRGGLDRTPS
jgi:shikimate kinase